MGSGFLPSPVLTVVELLDLGTSAQGDTVIVSLVVGNAGSAPLIGSASLSDDGSFYIETDSLHIDLGGEISIQVGFAARMPGSMSASLTIESNDPVRPVAVVTLVGFVEAPPPVVGDFDGDRDVDLEDFFLFADRFGQAVSGADAVFDLDGDEHVDLVDFFLFAEQYGTRDES